MKILVDSTNPANDDKLLYLTIMEVPDDTVDKEKVYGTVQYLYVNSGPGIDGECPDVFDIGIQLVEFVVDLTYSADKLFQRADKAILEYYMMKGKVPEDDHYIVAVQQFYLELLKAIGCEGVYWVYM